MKKVLDLTNKYIILATPLILYSLISSIYLISSTSSGKIIHILFAIFLFMLMTGAFIAGWGNMIKTAVLNPERQDVNSLIQEFPSGVGEYFLSSLGAILMIFIVFLLTFIASFYIGINSIGDPGVSIESISKAMQNTAELKAFLATISPEQLVKINLWNMLIMGSATLTYFILLLYIPTIFFKKKNPFVAFFVSLKDLFSRKIFKTIGLFLLIFVINFLISLLSALLGANAIMHFVITLLNFYFITAISVGIFYYYKNNFVDSLIGQNVDIQI